MSRLDVLPTDSRRVWRMISRLLPPVAYLMGGTAIVLHLRHRESRDLDFFLSARADLGGLAARLQAVGPLAIQHLDRGTLNCLFGQTKLQFLEASEQRMIEAPEPIEGIAVGGLADLLAAMLVAVTHRPELRDYVDLWAMETIGGRRVEEGLALVEARYPKARDERTWRQVVLALGSFEEVRGSPMPRMRSPHRVTARQIERYWRQRVPTIAGHLDQFELP